MISTRWASSTTFHASPLRGLIVHQGGRMPPTPHLMVWAETGTHTSVSTWLTPDFHQNATIVVALVDGGLDAVEYIDKVWGFD
jgi:hypothetical protein